MGRILVFGTSHRVAPARLRDGLYMDADFAAAFLGRLAARDEVSECAALHTCTRLEIYAVTDDAEATEAAVVTALAELGSLERVEIEGHSYALADVDAARHVLRVAAGLDSIVLGESQILGQVRESARIADTAGVMGPILRRLLATSIRTGKRARTETEVAMGPTSLAAAAVRLAVGAADDFPARRVLVVGAGETARLAARHVAKRRPAALIVANRTPERAACLAAELDAETVPLAAVPALLADVDVVITAIAAEAPILSAGQLTESVRGRDNDLVVVDLGRPRNVERPPRLPPRLRLVDLDGLADGVQRNRARQARQIPLVEAIVTEELDRFVAWWRSRDVVPHVRALRQHFFRTGMYVLERHGAGLDDAERAELEAYTRGLIAKLLHAPTVRLKEGDYETEEGRARLRAVSTLFDLDV